MSASAMIVAAAGASVAACLGAACVALWRAIREANESMEEAVGMERRRSGARGTRA